MAQKKRKKRNIREEERKWLAKMPKTMSTVVASLKNYEQGWMKGSVMK